MTDDTPELLDHEGIFEDLTAGPDDADARLDVFLTQALPLSRARVQHAIEAGEVLLRGVPASKSGVKLRAGDLISCRIPPPPQPDLTPENIPLEFLHQDDDLVVLLKPAGLVVHPAPGHPSHTLVNALLYHFQHVAPPLDGAQAVFRPGIVHRLDKDTSGVMVAARSARAQASLAEQFAAHTIERRYLALVLGVHLESGTVFDTGHSRHTQDRRRYTGQKDTARRAITKVEVLEKHPSKTSLLACTLQTGRTHQIRMHLAEHHAPILGDVLYGGARAQTKLIARQALHAEVLGFQHPDGRWLRFEAPPPADFQAALDALRAGKRV